MSQPEVRAVWRPVVDDVWKQFQRGLTVPSLLSTVLCLGLAAIYLAGLFGLVNENVMLRYGDRFLAQKGTDYDFFVACEAMQLAHAPVDSPMLVLTGASTTRCTLLPSELEEAFRARGQQPPRVFRLCASNQPVVMSVAWWDMIPDGARGYLVVGVSPGTLRHGMARLAQDYRDGRLGVNMPMVSDALAREGKAGPPRTGIYGLDHARFLLSRAMVPLKRAGQWFEPVVEVESLTHGLKPLEPGVRESPVKRALNAFVAMQPEQAAEALGILREGIEKLRSRTSLEIVLLETPVMASFIERGQLGPLFERVNGQLEEMAAKLGVPCVKINTELAIPDSAYYDMIHLCDPEWTSRCAQLVVDRMLDRTQAGAVEQPASSTRGAGRQVGAGRTE